LNSQAKFLSSDKISVMDINGCKIVICDGDGDIDIGIGMASCDIFIDMHSSGKDDFIILPSSLEGMNIIENANNIIEKLQNLDYSKLKLGISEGNINCFKDKIIDVDVKVAYLEANEKFLFILFDSNNMENREILNHTTLNLKEDIKIFPCTTDSHNKENGKFEMKLREGNIREISKLVEKAINNADHVSAEYQKLEKNLKIMGKGAELLPTANFAVITLKFLLPFLILIASFFIIFAIIMWG